MNCHSISKQGIARLKILLAMTAFGTLGVFIRNIDLPTAEIAFWRGIIAFSILLGFILLKQRFTSFKKLNKKLGYFFISGIALGVNWIFLFEAYNHTSVALSTLSYYFAPTLMIIISAILFKEKLGSKQIICFLASTSGLILIIGVTKGGNDDLVGISYGLAAAVLYATVVIFNKGLGTIDGIMRTSLQFFAVAIVLFPYVYFTKGFQILQLDQTGLLNLLVVGIFHTGIIYYFYFTSLADLKGQQVAILSYVDPLIAVLISVFILWEPINKLQILGGFLILIFTLINEINLQKASGFSFIKSVLRKKTSSKL